MVKTKKHIMFACMALGLTACDAMKENTNRAADGVGTWYDNTRHRVANYIYDPNRRPPEIPPAPPARYCYRVQTDILCYSEPKADAKNRLVAGQDAHGYIETVTFENPSAMAPVGTPTYVQPYGMSAAPIAPVQTSGLGGHYDAGPGVAPPLDTVTVGDVPGVTPEQPFYYVQSPSVIDKMDGVKASYDTAKAKGVKSESAPAPAADAAPAAAEPVSIPPSLLEDHSVIKASASDAPTPLMIKN